MASITEFRTPTISKARSEFARGWPSIVWSALALNVAAFVVLAFSFGVLFSSISPYFNGNRTLISGLYSVFLVSAALGMPLIGWSIDRFGMRQTVIPLVFIYGLTLVSLYILPPSRAGFYLAYTVVGLTAGATSPLPHFKVASRWFDEKRGLVFGLLMAGTSSGAVFVPLLTGWIIKSYGWQAAYGAWGCLVIAVIVPCILMLKERPEAVIAASTVSASCSPSATSVKGITRAQALRSKQFWIMAIAMGLMFSVTLGLLGHLGPMLLDQGASLQIAATVASVFAAAGFVGRILGGYLIDRFFAPRVAACLFVSSTLGLILLISQGGVPAALLAAALIGLTFGAETDVLGYLVTRYFGVKSFAEIFSYLYSIVIFLGMLGPIPLGFIHDQTGSYATGIVGYAVVSLGCALLLLWLGPYAFNARSEE